MGGRCRLHQGGGHIGLAAMKKRRSHNIYGRCRIRFYDLFGGAGDPPTGGFAEGASGKVGARVEGWLGARPPCPSSGKNRRTRGGTRNLHVIPTFLGCPHMQWHRFTRLWRDYVMWYLVPKVFPYGDVLPHIFSKFNSMQFSCPSASSTFFLG